MSTLISSATTGKKAAPKAPPRRRPAAPAPPPPPKKAPTPVEESPTEAQAAPLVVSPASPATQKPAGRLNAGNQQVRFAEPVSDLGRPPSPRKAPEPPPAPVPAPTSEQAPQEATASVEQAPVIRDFAAQEEQPQAQQRTPDPSQQQSPQYEHRQIPVPQAPAPTAVMISGGQTEPTRAAKRTRDESAAPARQRKAPKRSSVRSNTTVQTEVEDDGQPGPSTRPRAQSPPVPRRMRLSDQQAFVPSPGPEDDDEGEENERPITPAKAPAKRKGKKIKTPARVQEDLDGDAEQHAQERDKEENQEPTAPKPKKPRKPRQKRAPKAKSAATTGAENQAERAAGEERPAEERNAEEEAAADDDDESDPELHEIDPNKLSMFKITYQKRYGKTSAREKEMQTIDWDEVARKRREAAEIPTASKKEKQRQAQLAQSQSTEDGVVQSTEDGATGAPTAEGDSEVAETRVQDYGLGFRLVDGEIVMDEDTLTVDRRAQAQAAIAEETFVEEVNDLTVRHNRMTYMNDRRRFEEDRIPVWKAKSEAWDEDNTDRFYEALRCWGTDFMIISRLFPGKNRAQIKKKFLREERLDPTRITASLLGKATTSSYSSTPLPPPRSMSLTDYATAANVPLSELNKFDSLEHANSLISDDMRDKELAMQAVMEEEVENERQKKVQQEQRAKGAAEKEKRKALSAAKKAARAKGQTYGTGTFGGVGGGDEDAGGGAEG